MIFLLDSHFNLIDSKSNKKYLRPSIHIYLTTPTYKFIRQITYFWTWKKFFPPDKIFPNFYTKEKYLQMFWTKCRGINSQRGTNYKKHFNYKLAGVFEKKLWGLQAISKFFSTFSFKSMPRFRKKFLAFSPLLECKSLIVVQFVTTDSCYTVCCQRSGWRPRLK